MKIDGPLACRIREQDFRDDIDADEVESTVIDVLGRCFRCFDLRKGREGASAEARFLTYFRSCLRRRFEDRLRDQESR
ncbi:hypothetical protein [Tautonia plasticadhaerens]|uniref:Uncharacterized protein n=1 Tax=Tautonia plasticadhaerens TaxID=2527974 RepID=A0A518HED7_9BACT|nr:hypothetical protein [Tautonia plasticadhaerens]QDV39207.1 hypothetical protein ElP_71710 [Tautonia plasticadhaerens]